MANFNYREAQKRVRAKGRGTPDAHLEAYDQAVEAFLHRTTDQYREFTERFTAGVREQLEAVLGGKRPE